MMSIMIFLLVFFGLGGICLFLIVGLQVVQISGPGNISELSDEEVVARFSELYKQPFSFERPRDFGKSCGSGPVARNILNYIAPICSERNHLSPVLMRAVVYPLMCLGIESKKEIIDRV